MTGMKKTPIIFACTVLAFSLSIETAHMAGKQRSRPSRRHNRLTPMRRLTRTIRP